MLEEYSEFEPCLMTMYRDPSVVGRPSFEYGIHRWNVREDECSFRNDLIADLFEYPLPLKTIKLMEHKEVDFEKPNLPLFCPDCFGEIGGRTIGGSCYR